MSEQVSSLIKPDCQWTMLFISNAEVTLKMKHSAPVCYSTNNNSIAFVSFEMSRFCGPSGLSVWNTLPPHSFISHSLRHTDLRIETFRKWKNGTKTKRGRYFKRMERNWFSSKHLVRYTISLQLSEGGDQINDMSKMVVNVSSFHWHRKRARRNTDPVHSLQAVTSIIKNS
jgi:hypothetical protein